MKLKRNKNLIIKFQLNNKKIHNKTIYKKMKRNVFLTFPNISSLLTANK
jgi:hypothetical protein